MINKKYYQKYFLILPFTLEIKKTQYYFSTYWIDRRDEISLIPF